MNLAGIDLNLLLVFDAIMRERHVTRAGDLIGLSQPAVSNALNRLRHHLKDDLFIRSSKGMRPTARALELSGPIRASLENLAEALEPVSFDPQTARHSFAIGTNDYCVSTIIPDLVARIEQEAPGVNLRLMSSAGRTFEMLDSQQIDFGVSTFGVIPDRFESRLLLEDEYVLVHRNGHPLANQEITLDRYLAARHLVVSPSGQAEGFVDEALTKEGLTRQVAMVVNSFASAPAIVAQSDLLLAVPRHIAHIFCPKYDLIIRPSLYPGPPEYSSITLVWHSRLSHHPAYAWMREMLQGTVTNLPAPQS